MGTLFIGAHPIGGYIDTIFDWTGHYFLLYSEDGTPSYNDKVIRGGQDSEEKILINADIEFYTSADYPTNWNFYAGILAPDSPYNYYGYEALDLGDRDAKAVWNTLVSVAEQIGEFSIDYDRPNQNSNSVVATLLQSVGLEIVEPEILGSYSYSYPGAGRALTSDWLTSDYYSYEIVGNDRDENDDPIDDILNALTGSELLFNGPGDFVSGLAGDDFIADGSRDDVLEGGEGNDTYFLTEDDEADLVVVGKGDDTVLGGEFEDRLVLRLDGMLLPEEAVGLGEDEATSAIPLLGGFFNADAAGPIVAQYIAAAQETFDVDLDPEYDEFPVPTTHVRDIGASAWEEVTSFETDQLIVEWSDPENNLTYDLAWNELPFSITYSLDDDTLEINIGYTNSAMEEVQSSVTVYEFEEGDFGVFFTPFDSIPTSVHNPSLVIEPYEDTYYAGSEEDVLYLNNNGNYITIPEEHTVI